MLTSVVAMAAVTETAAALSLTAGARPLSWPVWLPLQLVGLSFVVAGVIAWRREPANATGRLMAAVGLTWYLGDLQVGRQPVLFAIGFCLFYLPSAIFTHLILALPTGRLQRRVEWAVVLALYASVTATQVLRYLVEDPREPQVWGSGRYMSVWGPVATWLGAVCITAAFWLVVQRWWVAGTPVRRRLAVMWSAGAVAGVVALVWGILGVAHPWPAMQAPMLLTFALVLIVTPFGILAGLLRVRLARLGVATLVMRLQESADPGHLRDALSDVLGDPGLRIGLRMEDGRFVDSAGGRVEVPADPRRVTVVARHHEHLATLIHDPALSDQAPLVEAVVAAASLALENARLLAEQRLQLEEVRASRARIVAAADEERSRIQRDLHDGAQHRLLAVSLMVGRLREELAGNVLRPEQQRMLTVVAAQLRDIIRELRQLTEGIDPPALNEQGLSAVVEMLAERAPLPVKFAVPGRRWPVSLERTAYFVIHEALSNVYKHAGATRAEVSVEDASHRLVVRISDDGVGGADPRGSGLRGLRDRVTTVGGTMRIDSGRLGGTTITAELPCKS
ncbi:sensor histidine kinase [Actinoplanes subtropicus]|uniref:sensor histidine kinase n=1 Tax=Actinoplanes subtropicus TaxID=543632 RepID=UPI000555F124|nr:histidine kinase [Actinoplanes subtropicus]